MDDSYSLDSCTTQELRLPDSAAGSAQVRHVDPTTEALYREALDLWLRWTAEHDQVTHELFAARRDPGKMAELLERMDQIDQLRWRAIDLSQTLLEKRG